MLLQDVPLALHSDVPPWIGAGRVAGAEGENVQFVEERSCQRAIERSERRGTSPAVGQARLQFREKTIKFSGRMVAR